MIKERIIQLLEYKGVPKEKFYLKIGMTSANFRGKAKNSPLNSTAIENILSEIPGINPSWLLTGKGEMLLSKENTNHFPIGKKMVPLIPIDAMAGFGSGDISVMEHETEKYYVPEFERLNVDYMIRVKGSSMIPKYNSGDIVACIKVSLQDIFFQWNKVYVLDTVQGALIKRIHPGSDDEHIKIISENESYPSFELNIERDVRAVALVVGVVRLE